jgi:hypothetical protein
VSLISKNFKCFLCVFLMILSPLAATAQDSQLTRDLRSIERGFVAPSLEAQSDALSKLVSNLKICIEDVATRSDGASFDEDLGLSELLSNITETVDDTQIDLSAALDRLLQNKDGLEKAIFANLRTSIAVLRVANNAHHLVDPITTHRQNLDRLYAAVNDLTSTSFASSSRPRVESERNLREAMKWLQDHNQEQRLIETLKSRMSSPNQMLMVSERFLNRMIRIPIKDTIPLNTERDETKVTGNADISGIASLDLLQNNHEAKLQLRFDAGGPVSLEGQRKRTVFSGSGAINIGIMQTLYLKRDHEKQVNELRLGEFEVSKADVNAEIDSAGVIRNHALLARNRNRVRNAPIRAKIAHSELQKRDKATDAEIAEKIEDMRQGAPTKAIEFGGEMKALVEKFIWTPLRRKDLYPESISISSTHDHLIGAISVAANSQLAALTAPSRLADEFGADVVMRMHESVINNLSGIFAGELVSDDEFAKWFTEVIGANVSNEANENSAESSSSVDFLFSRTEPVHAEFHQNKATITLRMSGFEVDGIAFTDREFKLQATYIGSPLQRGLRFERSGDVRVEAVSGEAKGDDYDALRKVSGRLLFQSAQTDGIEINTKMLPHIAGIAATAVQFQDSGWLVVLMKSIDANLVVPKSLSFADLKKLQDSKQK